jgi:hypothetical protein
MIIAGEAMAILPPVSLLLFLSPLLLPYASAFPQLGAPRPLQDNSRAVEAQLEPFKSGIEIPPFQRTSTRAAGLMPWPNAIYVLGQL